MKLSVFIVAMLVVGATSVFFAQGSASASTSFQKLGFGNSGADPNAWMVAGYTCQTYYNGIMMTPPYPSALMWQLGSGPHWSGSASQDFLDCMGNHLNSNQYMILLFGLNHGNTHYDSSYLPTFKSYVKHLASESFRGQLLVGIDGEHSAGMPVADFKTVVSFIQGLGLRNANRYLGSEHDPYIAPVNELQNTPYPFAGLRSFSIAPNNPAFIGVNVGVNQYAPYPFVACGPGYGSGSGYPGWTDGPVSKGYAYSGVHGSQPCSQDWPYSGAASGTIQDVLASNAGRPHAEFVLFNNDYVYVDWAEAKTGGIPLTMEHIFLGASGLLTNFVLDNPQFRNQIWQWVQAHAGIYLLGNKGTLPLSVATTTGVVPMMGTAMIMLAPQPRTKRQKGEFCVIAYN